ncbi:glycosyltransferase [Amycolatopsis sp. NEAU-NG30]|uniref:Glycosyltransferase n=1 Tax=Amycolatopsis melonis TaxID=3156488 RepID=A0ABV0LJ79_9PSEU
MVAVLHVLQPGSGGAASYVSAAAADQRARGWRVAVAGPARIGESLARQGVPLLPWQATREPGPATAAEARRLARLVRAFRPDLVHLHSAKAGLAGRLAVRGRLPTLFQPHGWSWAAATGMTARAALRWERHAARWADVIVCVGSGEAEAGRRGGVGGTFTVVRTGVDLDRFRPDTPSRTAARSLLGIAPQVRLAVCVGRLTRQKGQDRLLAAWPRIRAACPDALLALVGDGEVPRGPGVRHAGHVADVRPWLSAADVVVQPSRWEGLPLSTLEAMACGRSVVATDVAGLRELVRPGTGAVVPPDALAGEILRRFADDGLAVREGAEAARCARGFDVRDTWAALAEVSKRAAGGWSAAACRGLAADVSP